MAKIIYPKAGEKITFKRETSIPTPSGQPLKITFEFQHIPRAELAALLTAAARESSEAADAVQSEIAEFSNAYGAWMSRRDAAKAAGVDFSEPKPEMRDSAHFAAESIARDVAQVLKFTVGWDVEDTPFNADELTKFFNYYGGAAEAMKAEFRVALVEGRLGN